MRTILSGGLLLAALALLPALGSAGDDFKLEPGFTLLFNGKDLSGWKTKKEGVSLDGKNEAYGKRFAVVEGKIVIDPKVKGDVIIETAKTFGKDVHLKFEYLPGKGCNNDLFIRGIKFDITPKGVKNLKEGEWNQFEIVIAGDKAEFKNNGESQRTAKPGTDATPFGVRAEFGPIEFRRMRFKE
jgi:hypothetical protein